MPAVIVPKCRLVNDSCNKYPRWRLLSCSASENTNASAAIARSRSEAFGADPEEVLLNQRIRLVVKNYPAVLLGLGGLLDPFTARTFPNER